MTGAGFVSLTYFPTSLPFKDPVSFLKAYKNGWHSLVQLLSILGECEITLAQMIGEGHG